MITFIISLAVLIFGYFLYGHLVERVFCPDNRNTPAVSKRDNVDFIPLPNWKVYMIQFLNIAGTGPIFGAIMGAKFGPVAYLWIVFGTIFAGAVHDYLSGMVSMRNGGASLPGRTLQVAVAVGNDRLSVFILIAYIGIADTKIGKSHCIIRINILQCIVSLNQEQVDLVVCCCAFLLQKRLIQIVLVCVVIRRSDVPNNIYITDLAVCSVNFLISRI